METSAQVKEIKVKLLLAGGHQYTVFLKSDAPMLENLLKTVVARSYKQEDGFYGLFQIPIDEGRASLCFPSEHLVGVVTEPSVFVMQEELKPQPTDVLASPYVQIDNFLTQEEHKQLLDYVFKKEPAFVPTSISTDATDYRRSMALYSFPEFSERIVNRLRAILPDIFSKLGIPSFPVSQIESQLTSHNDGNYYKVHNDNGSPDTATRELTYVYYFYREPKAFSGGELLIYDSKIENNFYVKADSFKTVEPRNNSIVLFLSRYMHEVLPVQCPSKAFADSRFTINGWVRR
ncbi:MULTISPECIES: 2OG-Fe(II) oxygenase [unclassified Coleofasciculus]|uniref:2OG-Fe(II) oxygenase n=1 Tax=Cyanophyceae TaxID=3028117 RepID=UPI0016850D73|nr:MULTISPECIES: 2OG-Fe(II) oxygenase [unclassified Coleofasciculus]MBD1890388.1 2OG-Fe(II) oxygenase [Coleofasciculus sp. FACHB-SPT9]MBD1894237.1 2OG-Fe(II) oxygenase [Coleofasciculus sp. FACHB-129]MBD2537993.1 2OG-Fe(II) oxygenase [Coleofasciculus sp. FACHB-SPT36]